MQAIVMAACLLVAADVDDVTAAYNKLQEAYNKGDAEYIRKNITKDHVVVTTYSQFFDAETQLKDLPNLKVTSYKVSGFKFVTLDKADVALVSYEAAVEGTYKGKKLPARVQVVGIWVKRDGKWIEASYQETPLAE